MTAVTTVTTPGETAALCASVGISRAAFYRHRRPAEFPRPRRARVPSPRALDAGERQAVLDVLHSDRFVDQSPAEVHATLLEEQTYLCSPRTMYRILAHAGEVRERRDQARHPAYTKPELVATAPNQIWSWDITKLKGPIAYLYFSLYVILDLFSRYVVGWMVATQESARLAERLIAATCEKQAIGSHQLTIHADRGAPMRSKLVADLFADLGIAASHSRPRVSNDNPFPKPNSGRSNIGPNFRTGSARSRMRARFATPSSRGTTTRIITVACAISRRRTCTMAGLRRSSRAGITRAWRRTRRIPSASSKGRRDSRRCRPRCGSTRLSKNRRARMPYKRRSRPPTTRSMG